MRKLLLVLGCLFLATVAIASLPPYEPPGTESTVSPPPYVPPGTGPTTSPPSYAPPGTGSTVPPQEGPGWSNPDWLSADVGLITYYGPYGYPTAMGFYDDRMLHDEWYPVARSFLDGTAYRTYYYTYYQPIYLDGGWWKDPRGYRPLYRIGPGFVFRGTSS
jgi:hypothetical protein